jgi:hypothetical protein
MKICHANNGNAPTDAQEMPPSLGNISNAKIENFIAAGWRLYVPSTLPNIKSSAWVDSGTSYYEDDVVQYTAEELAEQKAARQAGAAAARLASFQPLIPLAVLYRAALRKHFGPNAETNRDVTETMVAAYFDQKRIAGTITSVETADAIALARYFEILAAWNGTGETWTLPYEVLPA